MRRTSNDRASLVERFWAHVKPTADDACWPWSGKLTRAGYGRVFMGLGVEIQATHLAWFVAHGEWPGDGRLCCHSCDNPSCVRIDHLFLGTPLDNWRDCHAKGRTVAPPHRTLTHCKKAGHPLTPDNTMWSQGYRRCRACRIEYMRRKEHTFPSRVRRAELRALRDYVDAVAARSGGA